MDAEITRTCWGGTGRGGHFVAVDCRRSGSWLESAVNPDADAGAAADADADADEGGS